MATKIQLKSPTGDSYDTSVTLEDGTPIPGVSAIKFALVAGETAKAEFEFCEMDFDTRAEAELVPFAVKLWRQFSPKDKALFVARIVVEDAMEAAKFEALIGARKCGDFTNGGMIPSGGNSAQFERHFISRETVLTKKQQEKFLSLANGGKPE
jgi:hypothetical protein